MFKFRGNVSVWEYRERSYYRNIMRWIFIYKMHPMGGKQSKMNSVVLSSQRTITSSKFSFLELWLTLSIDQRPLYTFTNLPSLIETFCIVDVSTVYLALLPSCGMHLWKGIVCCHPNIRKEQVVWLLQAGTRKSRNSSIELQLLDYSKLFELWHFKLWTDFKCSGTRRILRLSVCLVCGLEAVGWEFVGENQLRAGPV